jgi:hypothetical protein
LHSLFAKNEASKRAGPGEKAKRKKDYRNSTDAIFCVFYNQRKIFDTIDAKPKAR